MRRLTAKARGLSTSIVRPTVPSHGYLVTSVTRMSPAAVASDASFAAYSSCLDVLTGDARTAVQAIRAQERSHAAALAKAIEDLGGTPPPGRSRAEYERTFPMLRTADDALRFAEDLEERQVRAYLEAVTEFPALELRLRAAGLCADEANHLGAVRVLQGLPAAQGPFVTGAL